MKSFYQIVFNTANKKYFSPVIYKSNVDAEHFASHMVGVLGITSYLIRELRCYDL